MPHLVFFAAVLAGTVLAASPICAQAPQGTAERPGERVADAGATGQTAGEAIVPPVKRVAPRTPVFTYGAAGGAGGSGHKKQNQPIVPSRPDCDPGFKVDDSGKRCVKVAGGDTLKSDKKKKNR
jgi:hypothetical protein